MNDQFGSWNISDDDSVTFEVFKDDGEKRKANKPGSGRDRDGAPHLLLQRFLQEQASGCPAKVVDVIVQIVAIDMLNNTCVSGWRGLECG